jgi:hypothetical protein
LWWYEEAERQKEQDVMSAESEEGENKEALVSDLHAQTKASTMTGE